MSMPYTIHTDLSAIDAGQWDALLAASPHPSPFMRHAYLYALQSSGSATIDNGWQAQFITLEDDAGALIGAAPLYIKQHSYGEYIFDWAWAQAYQQHGLPYYPKAIVAVPFTPVPASRLLATDPTVREQLVQAVIQHTQQMHCSSLHLLWADSSDIAIVKRADAQHTSPTAQESAASESDALSHWSIRNQVQFHWHNQDYADFQDYLASLKQSKRKKVRAEQRKVAQANVHWEYKVGKAINNSDWAFFYRCYEQTYYEHGNAPYLKPAFFTLMQATMPENWLMCIARKQSTSGTQASEPIAASLVAIDPQNKIAYGRYWGAIATVDCLHFDACYYQPIHWCITNNYQRFEGGAQGEHKMARGLTPATFESAHWIAHPEFAKAIDHYTRREALHNKAYHLHLQDRTPYKT